MRRLVQVGVTAIKFPNLPAVTFRWEMQAFNYGVVGWKFFAGWGGVQFVGTKAQFCQALQQQQALLQANPAVKLSMKTMAGGVAQSWQGQVKTVAKQLDCW